MPHPRHRSRTDPQAPTADAPLTFKRPGSSRRSVGLMVALVVVMVAAGSAAGVLIPSGSSATASQLAKASSSVTIPGQDNKPLAATNAQLMGLKKLEPHQAPGFTLVDQHGTKVSLAGLARNHEVVLAFMDDRCTDICPIVGHELADAYHDLGATAKHVVFVSVNVNAAHHQVHWLDNFIHVKAPELATLPDFHYVTGSPSALQKVWRDYHLTVKVQAGKVYHSEALYFIGPGGAMRYQATPFANQRSNGTGWLPTPTITQWGHGIAQYARTTLRLARAAG